MSAPLIRRAPCAVAIAALMIAVATPFASQRAIAALSYTVMHHFDGGADGGDPAGPLTFNPAGALFGTTVVGGTAGCGTVFELGLGTHGFRPEKVLYDFQCGTDGKNPYGGITFDANGDLYGTTVSGGAGGACTGDGCGTVWEVTQAGEQVLHNFKGGGDGFGPGGPIAFDASGDIFGTTPDGGAHQQGVVYELRHVNGSWRESIIHAFTGGVDGSTGSLGALLVDASGDLFGVTEGGGAHGLGVVFEMRPESQGWTYRTLYAFRGTPDASSPYGGLSADSRGDLFGTTYYGGKGGLGAVFELRASPHRDWTESVVHSFAGGGDGANPTSTPEIDAAQSDLVGTTSMAGDANCQCGTVFKIKLDTRQETTVFRFGGAGDGAYPYYGLAYDGSGTLYTTTASGGAGGQGTAVEISPR